jgi:predicted RNA-binding Zn-ribbon protein involved in translation (DUF1610 family)
MNRVNEIELDVDDCAYSLTCPNCGERQRLWGELENYEGTSGWKEEECPDCGQRFTVTVTICIRTRNCK